MSDADSKRDKVRELVREVLDTVPDEEAKPSFPEHIRVNSLPEERPKDFDRDESAKGLITEDDLRGLSEGDRLRISEGASFTPLARDIIAEKRIELVKKTSRAPGLKVTSIAIGCDHGGFELKEKIAAFLAGLGLKVRDFGTSSELSVDYPDFAHAVALAVAGNKAEVGIVIDGAGIGSAMTANKVPGVLAAACYNPALAKNSREHNGANVLTLGSGQNSYEEAIEIVRAFLTHEISEPRHERRVGKIRTIEGQYNNRS
ncbi:MAG: ribose 5-phosphate isomerase B [Acidobacteria bacterium]|nr:MAG: ribose 5-phosphate isomerase B [Acidobacteriota bacterium]REK02020.1 MAG: ribose 5-phosphate isomerase B [Acidobacteriota bacterium]REK14978.1 MAG: ribose 5-phosphate isomerase B [Acidobacteriota bacterium]REK45692.1 MAG: ribose 5-phosphate isomerase B [Acidobacteriota bacterium]